MKRIFTTRRLVALAFCLTTSVAACGSMWDHLLGPLKEGRHRIQAVTPADLQRGHDVVACLQTWARANGHPQADYSNVPVDSLVIARVGGDGVIGYADNGKTSFQTDERQNGDTTFINEGVSNTEFVALERHSFVHMAQAAGHPELVGSNGDIHWPPPWDFCQVPRAIVGS